jgi:hypothetical protein
MSVLDKVRERYEAVGLFPIEVPEWDTTLYFHPVPPALFDKALRQEKGELGRNVALLIATARTEDDQPVFAIGDKAELMRKAEANVVSRIVESACNLEQPENDPER